MKDSKQNLSLIIFLSISVFAAGCQAATTIDERPAQTNPTLSDGQLSAGRQMSARRAAHTSTLLGDGRVLIAGGFVGEDHNLSSAELYDPARDAFVRTPDMQTARSSQTATLLPNGKVLIAGGFNGDYLDSAELFDAQTGKFSPAGKMTTARSNHVAVLLGSGKVLIAGGVGTGWTFLNSAELYDPAANTFTAAGPMSAARESHTATLLKDGRVLITGGHQGRRAAMTVFAGCEIFDPAKGTFSAAGNLTIRRHKHEAVLLGDGRVLILGGADERDSAGAYRNAEIYDPAAKTFSSAGLMNDTRYKLQGTVVRLKNGKILIAGGASRAEVFDPATGKFSPAAGDMGTIRLFAAATLLDSGKVLITGGYDNRMDVSPGAWLYAEEKLRSCGVGELQGCRVAELQSCEVWKLGKVSDTDSCRFGYIQ